MSQKNGAAYVYLAASEVDYRNKDYRYNNDGTEPDHPQPIVIMILKPDEQSHCHVDYQQNDGNGFEHLFKKGAPIPVVCCYLQKCQALIWLA